MKAEKMTRKLAASILTCSILLTNSLPLFAAEEFPTSTMNKDDVITIEKSAAWNGETTRDADFSATVTLKASGIQNVVGELSAAEPADISIVLDESGSMAACLNPSHSGNYPMIYASDLKTENQAKALEALKSSQKPLDLRNWIVKAETLGNEDCDVYLTPVKTTATVDNLSGWGVFLVAKDGSVKHFSDLFNETYTAAVSSFAPYFVGHFEMDGTVPVKHIVEAHGTDYYLAAPVQTGSGWKLSTAGFLSPSVDFRSVVGLTETEGCEYYHEVIRDSAEAFVAKLGRQYQDGKLAESSTVSLVPFAGIVDKVNMVSPASLGTEDITDAINRKIHAAYEALGLDTNWADAMETVANQLNAAASDRQKFVIFFTDGVPDMGAPEPTAENLNAALKASQSLYDGDSKNRMYAVFLNRKESDIDTMNRLVNAMNRNEPDSTESSSYVSVVNSGTSVEDIGADLDAVFNDILVNLEKWSKSTQIISVEDTISSYFSIDREKLEGTEGEDWKIETTEAGLEKITFYARIDGFTEIDQLEKSIPIVMKEAYRDTTAYYPTNEGDALCTYTDLNGDKVTVGTGTPYLPVENEPKTEPVNPPVEEEPELDEPENEPEKEPEKDSVITEPVVDANEEKEIDYNKVKTGDDFNLYFWIGLAIVSAAGVIFVVIRYRKLKKDAIDKDI